MFLLKEEGAVFKVAYNQIRTRKNVLLKSLNPIFEPYEVSINEVMEVCKYVYYFTDEVPQNLSANEAIMHRLTKIEERLVSNTN